ncbi:MAG TPA: DUF998 domain-containing protein [Mycobacterium sp.]
MATGRGAALWIVAAVGYLALEAVAAAGFVPAYSYARNYISDLGVNAISPRSCLMHAAFYLQGILFFLGGVLIAGVPESPRARVFLGLLGANSIGNIVIGTVHSGNVHRAGAALAIVGGNTAILAGSAVIATVAGWPRYRLISTALATVGLLSLLMLLINSGTSKACLLPDGVWERGSVYSITAWQLLTAGYLLSVRRRTPAA